MSVVVHYVLAILEGGLAGGYFYYAGQEEKKERKVLLYATSALWFLSSLLESMIGGREWKKRRKTKTIEIIEGEYEEEGERDND